MHQEQFEGLVQAFCEAAINPEVWPTMLGKFANAFGSTGVTAYLAGGDFVQPFNSHGLDGAMQDYLDGGWHPHNQRLRRGLEMAKAGHKGFLTEYRMFAESELAHDPWEQEFATRHGMEAEAGILLTEVGGIGFVMTAPRHARAGSYEKSEIAKMNALAKLLVPAANMAIRLKSATLSSFLHSLPASQAAALVTIDTKISSHNAAFEALIGRYFHLVGGRLVVKNDPRATSVLSENLRVAVWNGRATEKVVLRDTQGCGVNVCCYPIAGSASDAFSIERAIIFVDQLSIGRSASFADQYGLTPAEWRLTAALASGQTLRAAADQEQITYETARTRLKVIFQKTGVNRQLELIFLLKQ